MFTFLVVTNVHVLGVALIFNLSLRRGRSTPDPGRAGRLDQARSPGAQTGVQPTAEGGGEAAECQSHEDECIHYPVGPLRLAHPIPSRLCLADPRASHFQTGCCPSCRPGVCLDRAVAQPQGSHMERGLDLGASGGTDGTKGTLLSNAFASISSFSHLDLSWGSASVCGVLGLHHQHEVVSEGVRSYNTKTDSHSEYECPPTKWRLSAIVQRSQTHSCRAKQHKRHSHLCSSLQ